MSSLRRLSQGELRRVERVANDFDEWASQRQNVSIREVCEGVGLSLVQQLRNAGYSKEEASRFFEVVIYNAFDPLNAPVFIDTAAKGDA